MNYINSYPTFKGRCCPTISRLKFKICHSIPVCITLYHALIIYVHSIYLETSRVCIHFSVHEHLVLNGICRESLDVTYQCVVNEVIKTSTTKNSTIVMATSKQLFIDYLLKSLSNGERYHLAGSFLEVVMAKFRFSCFSILLKLCMRLQTFCS